VGNFIAGEGVHNRKTWVEQYKNGLPKILGYESKTEIESLKRRLDRGDGPLPMDRALISTLSMFRALSPPRHIPNFGTVTDPFKGQNRTLDLYLIRDGLSSLGALDYFNKNKISKPKFF